MITRRRVCQERPYLTLTGRTLMPHRASATSRRFSWLVADSRSSGVSAVTHRLPWWPRSGDADAGRLIWLADLKIAFYQNSAWLAGRPGGGC